MCISCPIAHIFISEYRKIKNYTKEGKKTISKNDKKVIIRIKIQIFCKKTITIARHKIKKYVQYNCLHYEKENSEFEMGTTTNILFKNVLYKLYYFYY